MNAQFSLETLTHIYDHLSESSDSKMLQWKICSGRKIEWISKEENKDYLITTKEVFLNKLGLGSTCYLPLVRLIEDIVVDGTVDPNDSVSLNNETANHLDSELNTTHHDASIHHHVIHQIFRMQEKIKCLAFEKSYSLKSFESYFSLSLHMAANILPEFKKFLWNVLKQDNRYEKLFEKQIYKYQKSEHIFRKCAEELVWESTENFQVFLYIDCCEMVLSMKSGQENVGKVHFYREILPTKSCLHIASCELFEVDEIKKSYFLDVVMHRFFNQLIKTSNAIIKNHTVVVMNHTNPHVQIQGRTMPIGSPSALNDLSELIQKAINQRLSQLIPMPLILQAFDQINRY